jgi:hypothetical protein
MLGLLLAILTAVPAGEYPEIRPGRGVVAPVLVSSKARSAQCSRTLCVSMWQAQVLIDVKGRVRDVRILKVTAVQYGTHLSHDEIFAAARKCLRPALLEWRFKPATRHGKAFAGWYWLAQNARCK